MTQEEKAKAYDKALERAKIWKDKSGMPKDKQGILDDIFPELAESEDELVWLTKYIEEEAYYLSMDIRDNEDRIKLKNLQKSLAWLEKQKSVGEIVARCKDSWYNEGKIRGQIEGLTDEEKYQQGWHDALEEQVSVDKDDERVEKIRKALIAVLKSDFETDTTVYDISVGEIIAWLEKQGNKIEPKFHEGDTMRTWKEANDGYIDGMPVVVSIDDEFYHCTNELIAIKDQDDYEFPPINVKQRPNDKVESKFHEGEWIVRGNVIAQILDVQEQYYVGLDTEGNDFTASRFLSDGKIHLWTIQDAKDGDVLQLGDVTAIFQEYVGNGNCKCYCSICDGEFKVPSKDSSYGCHNTIPATKEQRDLLFQKMREAGYEWDAEKKELKKIETNSDNILGSCEIEHIEHGKYYYCIKDYYAGGNKRASKGDVILAKRGMSMMALGTKANEYFLPVYQMPNHEWSEEDERNMQNIDSVVFYDNSLPEDTCVRLRNWLKSIKQRIGWKPSEGQMKVLMSEVEGWTKGCPKQKVLESLYNDLTKLK